jgi:hypothetical protein
MITQHGQGELSLILDRIRDVEVLDVFPHVPQAVDVSRGAKA